MFISDILQPTHLLLVLVVALLVLGPKRLPEVGRAVGRTMREFRGAIDGEHPAGASGAMETEAAPAGTPDPGA